MPDFTLLWPVDAPLNEDNPFGANPELYAPLGCEGHPGIDLMCPEGTPVVAAADGYVSMAGDLGTAGYAARIEHGALACETRYCHLSLLEVLAGDLVAKGQLIGLSGATGYTFGPHLHFDLWLDDEPRDNGYGGRVDPTPYLSPREGETEGEESG